jgi:hypothetical protein
MYGSDPAGLFGKDHSGVSAFFIPPLDRTKPGAMDLAIGVVILPRGKEGRPRR